MKKEKIVRKDLKMGSGKLAAQVAHAAILASERARNKNVEWFKEWFNLGQPKIILKVNSLKELETIHKLGQFNNLATAIVIDEGLTQLDAGTATCVGIGPAHRYLIDKFTVSILLIY